MRRFTLETVPMDEAVMPAASKEHIAGEADHRRIVQTALRSLRQKYRDRLILFHFHDQDVATTARSQELPWICALPGFVATIVALAVATWNEIGLFNDPVAIAAFEEQILQLTVSATNIGLCRILLASVITVMSVTLPSSLLNIRKSALP